MIYCFDIDGTICTTTDSHNYSDAEPIIIMINELNRLYDKGNYIKLFTARGASSGIDWTELTIYQMKQWNVKYHELIMNQKPSYDIFIDDKAYNADFWKKNFIGLIRGVIAGSFDIIHPGYIYTLSLAKNYCNHLTVALQEDPSIERSNKIKPILTVEERKSILNSIKYIDDILIYRTENDLEKILSEYTFDVRILGDDYKNKNIVGKNLCKDTIYIDRNHNWSTTKLKNMIKESLK